MFDEEADTISVEAGSDTMQAMLASASDTIPVDMIDFDDTAAVIVERRRMATDSDWPPPPKPPSHRRFRRVGVYKAITGVSKLLKIK